LSNLVEDILEFESKCKTVLAHESGDPGVQFNEKTMGRKSHDTVPLSGDGPDGPFPVAFEGVPGQGDDDSLLFHLWEDKKVIM
jgi:hypothetical protein